MKTNLHQWHLVCKHGPVHINDMGSALFTNQLPFLFSNQMPFLFSKKTAAKD